jgi:hypothetical protein
VAAPRTWTPFVEWQLIPPHPGKSLTTFSELVSRDLLWRELLQLADVPQVGRARFPGTLAQRNRQWAEFGSFIRQAKAYDDAGSLVKGPSAALLHYYTALNLAKAELLTLPNNPIYGQAIRHGLTYSATNARSIAGDVVVVQPGVFPHLYSKRTGLPLPTGTRLRVKRLLTSVPEVGWEVVVSKFASSGSADAIHAVVTNGTQGWALMAIDSPSILLKSRSTSRQFLRAFEQVTPAPAPNPQWRDVFGFSRRSRERLTFFESRWRLPMRPLGPGRYRGSDQDAVCAATNSALIGLIDLPTDEGIDATLTPSHLRGRLLPMPAGLARYAVMFYLSSLVRYRPSQVDRAINPIQHWLMSAFADQASVHTLQSMLSGITGVWHLYHSPGAHRL